MSSTFSLSQSVSLHQLGWRSCFSTQLALDELPIVLPARVMGIHRSAIDTLTEQGEVRAILPSALTQSDLSGTVAVGDWVLLEAKTARVVRILERQTVIARLAAGEQTRRQLIAANIDTLFIVTSCNEDFSISRLERYLSVAFDAHVEPVVVLTKADLCADVDEYLDQLRGIAPRVQAVAVNATVRESLNAIEPWLASGQTVAFVGSSGVGKSSLMNSLLGSSVQCTSGIREDDAKGRHTTTSRQMRVLPSGAWVIDTPGMRELKIGAVTEGVRTVFDDIELLAQSCRFRDCTHESEKGCAVLAALSAGQLAERRYQNFKKLRREAENAARTTHERHAREQQFGRMARSVQKLKKQVRRDT